MKNDKERTWDTPPFVTELDATTIQLAVPKVELHAGDDVISCEDIAIRYVFSPYPHLLFECKRGESWFGGNVFSNETNWQIVLETAVGSQAIEVLPVKSSPDCLIVTPRDERIDILFSRAKVCKVYFSLLNFGDFLGNKSKSYKDNKGSHRLDVIELAWDGWRVMVSDMPSSRERVKIAQREGYAITHVGEIRRSNRTSFEMDDVEPLLRGLRDFLSFAMGRAIAIGFPTGVDSDEKKLWQRWGMQTCECARYRNSWFDLHSGYTLEKPFQGFMRCWSNALWQKVMADAVYWYLLANVSERGVDTGIVLTQIALEKLSWNYLVNDKQAISETGFKDLKASDCFRLLCSHLGIPKEIPSQCKNLLNMRNDPLWDSLWAITDVRNSVVHPKKKGPLAKPEVSYEAWNLGMWYLEIVLLKLLGYDGKYANRLKDGRGIGDIEELPKLAQGVM